jgi:hypothetical protein
MGRLQDITERSFGDWTVLSLHGRGADRHPTWLCRCVCGVERVVSGGNLRAGGSLGCGCTKRGLRLRPYEALYNSIEPASKGRPVALSFEEFLTFIIIGQCHYCGAEVRWSEHHITRNGSAYNLDRKDNSIGYTKENCVVCCPRCNRSKSDHFTYAEWVQIGALIRSWN